MTALILLTLHILLLVTFTTRILLRDDLSPPARLAWFVVLLVLPYTGVIIYFLFGEIDLGNKANTRHAETFGLIRDRAGSLMGKPENTVNLIDMAYRPAFKYAASINGFHPVNGNKAELMADAAETTARLIADIDAAENYVHVLYYIWLDDRTGVDVAQALIRATKRGVVCRAMADGLGSRAFIKSVHWQAMKDAGVKMAVALPLNQLIRALFTSRIDLRNHRKITVIDSKVTYCGSSNCADPEFRVKPKYAPWIDIMFRFEGPIVAQNELLFLSDWFQSTDESLDDFTLTATSIEGGFPAQIMGDGPTERKGATPQLFANLIACARRTITLTTPYFVPDATVLEALCTASHRGVDVTLVFPKNNDSWIVAAASRSYYRKLLQAGCHIFEYKPGLLHAKTLTVDDRVSLIGSSNLDIRSFDLNYENNLMLQDDVVTGAICDRQKTYIEASDAVHLQDVKDWPYQKRIWNNVIATIGPIL